MSFYKVMVDDNFHYMDESERYEFGSYATLEEAVAVCRRLVDESLAESHRPGMTTDELCAHYASFGDDPFIIAPPEAEKGVLFSARNYAHERAQAICRTS
jgi:hypothetical protein